MEPVRFRTAGFNGYAVEFSPFFEPRLAVASAANYGIVGNGRLWILNANPEAGISAERVYDTQDGVYDVAWSESHERQVVSAGGDGSLKLWDVELADFPVKNWIEHSREVFSVAWNLVDKQTFLSASWDQTIKIWHPEQPTSLQTFKEHSQCVYQAAWSPTSPTTFASCSGDGSLKIWDTRSQVSSQTILAHRAETLCLDWNKYIPESIVTGSVDHSIKVWDLRRGDREVSILTGHEYAVRRVKCSPHSGDIVCSASYDMTMRVWNWQTREPVYVHPAHSEFVLGVDMNMFWEGVVATCAWDEEVHIVRVPGLAPGR
ncbi:WD40-repeat-containing domain protein [Phlyctochytrium arcticum]|nr:WD40-repeat-containing domain protein [Phlyctochytrium arcticum]